MDVPRVTEASTWDAPVAWTAPADDIVGYRVSYGIAGGTVIRLATTETSARVPDLPAGYDPEVSFPLPGARGEVQVVATRGDYPEDPLAVGFRFDAEQSTGPPVDISF